MKMIISVGIAVVALVSSIGVVMAANNVGNTQMACAWSAALAEVIIDPSILIAHNHVMPLYAMS
jgi:hypothetical protein